MAPLRSSRHRGQHYDNATGTTRRQGGAIDHDPTEGLPVRKWEQQYVTIKQNQKAEAEQVQGPNPDYPWPELPLPKDFHQLLPHSQEMLRRARMGNRAKPSLGGDPRNVLDEETVGDEGESKPAPVEEDRSYTVRRWVLAKVEKPDAKYLADRRPGLPPLYGISAQNETNMPGKKLVKVRKTDPVTGQQRIFDTMILEGGEAAVDGEIITEEEAAAAIAASATESANADSTPAVVTEALAPGTVVEGVGIVNEQGVVVAPSVVAAAAAAAEPTPVKRRPPPPKRKKHGPGRGRKKVVVARGEGVDVTGSSLTSGMAPMPEIEGASQPTAGSDVKTPLNIEGAADDREGSNLQDEGEGNDESGEEDGSEEGEIEEDGEEVAASVVQKDVEKQPAVVSSAEIGSVPTATDEQPTHGDADLRAQVNEVQEESTQKMVISPEAPIDPSVTTIQVTSTDAEDNKSATPTLADKTDTPNPQDISMEETKLEPADPAPSSTISTSAPSANEPVVGELDLLGSLEKTLDSQDAGSGSQV